jgi:site-specific recombinase XerD
VNHRLGTVRCCEVLALELQDVQLADGQMRVHGKGNKQRMVPLPPEILEVLGHYLRLERPLTNSPALFVSLKGRQRGQVHRNSSKPAPRSSLSSESIR